MASKNETDDVRAIEAIIDRQFRSLEWAEGQEADWVAFTGDFHADATLFPAGRPAKRLAVDAFVERMKGLAATSLHSFKQRKLGASIHIFGNVAMAMGVCENKENDEKATRSVEAMLLIKEDDAWKIVSQSWDSESEEKPIPGYLMS